MKALVTGSGGLIGSECVRRLCSEDWSVVGVDNDLRREFFGDAGSTRQVVEELVACHPRYQHEVLDIRDRAGVRGVCRTEMEVVRAFLGAVPSYFTAVASELGA